jgi:hypothetical protein
LQHDGAASREGVTHEEIEGIFSAEGALFWIVDDF